MGVQGLWSILEPAGQPVPPDSLRGKVLAVDVSIWLHQAVKGFRDKDGNPLPNAHLLGLFHRICKLLHYGVRPVFVFDGGVPALKRQTMSGRRQKKMEASSKAEVARTKLLSNYLQQHLQRESNKGLPPTLRMAAQIQALDSKSAKRSPQKKLMGDVSDLAEFRQRLDLEWEEDETEVEESSSDEEEDFRVQGRNYAEHFSTITSSHFDSLDLETQHEILFQMQESKKTNSWATMGEMPREAGEFSSFQMDRLLKRRFLQKKIQSVQKEMGQRHIHVQNLDELAMYEEEFGREAEIVSGSKGQGALLLKPKVAPIPGTSSDQSGSGVKKPSSISDMSNGSYKGTACSSSSKIKISEEEADIQVAIQLSLIHDRESRETETKQPIEDIGQEVEELSKAIHLSLESENSFKRRSSRSPRQYEVKQPSLVKSTNQSGRSDKPFEQSIADDMSTACYKFLGWVGFNDKVVPSSSSSPSKTSSQAQIPLLHVSSSGSEDDFEEVETGHDRDIVHEKCLVEANQGIGGSQPPRSPSIEELVGSSSEDDFEEVEGEVDEPRIEDEKSLVSHLLSQSAPLPISTGIQIHISEQVEPAEDLFADIFGDGPSEKVNSTLLSSGQTAGIELIEDGNSGELADPVRVTDTCPPKVFPTEFQLEKQGANGATPDFKNGEEGEGDEGIERTLPRVAAPASSAMRMISMDFMQRQEKLNQEQDRLKGTLGDQDRASASITDQMYSEAQELLSLFGIPFVVSPMEAEAQCAFLDAACMTDGTLTDDSDIWLFGALRVYKNFFAQGDRHVQFFQYADIVRKLHLNREKFILVAILSGSDYTNGIEGVGIVTALEIIAESGFGGDTPFETLVKFYDWWSSAQETRGSEPGNKLKEKWSRLKIRSGFPSRLVYDAYMTPTIDTSTEPFRWGSPDLDSLRQYAKVKFGWDKARTDVILAPALKNFQCQNTEIKRQSTLDTFITRTVDMDYRPNPTGHSSKRLQRAMKKIRQSQKSLEAPDEVDLSSDSDDSSEIGGKRKGRKSSGSSVKRKKVETSQEGSQRAHIPIEIIPQRLKSQAEREGNKKRAIQVLRKEKESGA